MLLLWCDVSSRLFLVSCDTAEGATEGTKSSFFSSLKRVHLQKKRQLKKSSPSNHILLSLTSHFSPPRCHLSLHSAVSPTRPRYPSTCLPSPHSFLTVALVPCLRAYLVCQLAPISFVVRHLCKVVEAVATHNSRRQVLLPPTHFVVGRHYLAMPVGLAVRLRNQNHVDYGAVLQRQPHPCASTVCPGSDAILGGFSPNLARPAIVM